MLLTVHARDPEGAAGEKLRREVPERGDDARPHQLDLPEQVRLAGRDLALERVAVLRRAALEDVGEVDVAASSPMPSSSRPSSSPAWPANGSPP